jgi:hypothetical protein
LIKIEQDGSTFKVLEDKPAVKQLYENIDYLIKNIKQEEVIDFMQHINLGVAGIKK